MVARLLMCIIVSCRVDRKIGWWPLQKSSLAFAYLQKKTYQPICAYNNSTISAILRDNEAG